jgi:hypothetical protein
VVGLQEIWLEAWHGASAALLGVLWNFSALFSAVCFWSVLSSVFNDPMPFSFGESLMAKKF